MFSPSLPNTPANNIDNSKRILLVDNEADVISLFKMVLEMNGFEVDAYNNPLEASSNFKPGFIRFSFIGYKNVSHEWF